jgi:succinoglycan biosynthesis transport protein ExoP
MEERADPMTTNDLPAPLASITATAPERSAEPRAFRPLGFPEDEGGLDWRRAFGAVLRFKWLIVVVTLLGTAAGVAATRFVSPIYSAQATVWIDAGERRGPDRGPIRPGQLLEPQAWVDLLKSYVVLDQVVRNQRLFLEPKSPADTAALATLRVTDEYRPSAYRLTVDGTGRTWTLTTLDGIERGRGAVGDSIGSGVGLLWAPREALAPGQTVEFTLATLRDAARRLVDGFDVQMDLNGNFLRLELRGANPGSITAIVNATVERYVEVAAELKRAKLTELTKILDEQLSSAQQNLRDAEVALETFRVHTITLPSDRTTATGADASRDPAFSSFFDTQIERDQAHRDRAALGQLLAQAGDSGMSADAVAVIPSVQRSPELSQALKELTTKQADLRSMKYRYSDAYPPVQRLAAEIATLEGQTIPALARGLARELATREAELGRRVDADSRNLRQIPPRVLEEARLRRAVTLAENLYTTLQQRYEEARLAEASTIPEVRILDRAVVSQRPVKNTASRIIVLGFLGGLGLAMLGAVLVDRVDPRVRYPDQVSRDMGLAILGALPHFPGRGNGKGATQSVADTAQVVEALRGACLNLVYAYGTAGPLVVTITSPGPGDGKSFLAANLAHTFAEGGHRTLLVDADIRRGVLHRRLAARRRPGLTDWLRGEVPFEAIVQETAHASLALVGCGTRAHNAPELLGSQGMGELISRWRAAYEVIILDTPPLGGGVDPLILGTLTGNLLLVLRTGYSYREVMAAKLEVLERLPIRVLGAVLNDVPPGRAYRYYSYYLPGYEAVDEERGHSNKGQPLVI